MRKQNVIAIILAMVIASVMTIAVAGVNEAYAALDDEGQYQIPITAADDDDDDDDDEELIVDPEGTYSIQVLVPEGVEVSCISLNGYFYGTRGFHKFAKSDGGPVTITGFKANAPYGIGGFLRGEVTYDEDGEEDYETIALYHFDINNDGGFIAVDDNGAVHWIDDYDYWASSAIMEFPIIDSPIVLTLDPKSVTGSHDNNINSNYDGDDEWLDNEGNTDELADELYDEEDGNEGVEIIDTPTGSTAPHSKTGDASPVIAVIALCSIIGLAGAVTRRKNRA